MNVDLSQFDTITDRAERAKAKADAVRKARQGGEGQAGAHPPSQASPNVAAAGPSVVGLDSADPGDTVLGFRPGLHFKWRGRAGRVVAVRYELVSFVYDSDAETVRTADRYRLSQAHSQGDLEFAPKGEVYRPERVASYHRVDCHDYVWLDSRSGMTAKKKRPRHIAIINPDYCTGCNACIEVCPTDCIEEVDVSQAGLDGIGKFCEVRLADCIGCIQCVKMCPWEAIDMVETGRVEDAYGIPEGTL